MQKRIHNILLFWKWKNESTFLTRLLWSSSSLFFYNSRKCRFSSLTFILYFMLVQILVIHSGKTFANRLDERALMKIVLSKQFFRICQHFFSSFLRLNVCFRTTFLNQWVRILKVMNSNKFHTTDRVSSVARNLLERISE